MLLALGYLLGHRATLDHGLAIIVCACATAALQVAMWIEMLRGGHGPVIRDQLARVEEAQRALQAHVTELEVVIVSLRAAIDVLLRKLGASDSRRTSGTGSFPAVRE